MTKPIDQNLYRDIVETIRNTLDIKIVKQKIVDVIGKALSADRCFILDYDKSTDTFLNISEEYLSSNTTKSYKGTDVNKNIPQFCIELKKGKTLTLSVKSVKLNGEELDLDNELFEKEKIAMKEYNVYSGLVFPLFYAGNFLGDLCLHYTSEKHEENKKQY